MFRAFLKWTALVFLVLESLALIASLLDLGLKIARSKAFGRAWWGETALELTLRLAIVGLILCTYLHLRNISKLPLAITRQSALLTTRAVQSALLACLALDGLVAERIIGHVDRVWLLSGLSLSALALGTVIAGLIFRSRLLLGANEELRRDPDSAKGLSRWRMVTTASMVLAMSIGLYGFFLRMMGNNRTVEWSFVFVSVALVILWGPHLGDGTPTRGTSRKCAPR